MHKFLKSFFLFIKNNFKLISENGILDPSIKQSQLDDRFYNNHSFKVGSSSLNLVNKIV
jgi:hypothetical protein